MFLIIIIWIMRLYIKLVKLLTVNDIAVMWLPRKSFFNQESNVTNVAGLFIRKA